MGTNIKSYATTQVHFQQERAGGLTAKSPNLSAKSKIFLAKFFKITLCLLAKFPANHADLMQFALKFCKTCKICTIYLPIIYYVSDA